VLDSTTFWITQLKDGNRDAAQQLWERYYRRLVDLARSRLNRNYVGPDSDESDVAQSAFASFYKAAEDGRFPQLADSADLWHLLITIAHRKIVRRLRYARAAKRKGPGPTTLELDLDALPGSEPTPDFCATAIESFNDLMNQLDSAALRTVAIMRMEGYANQEVADTLKCSLSSVERKLRLIRRVWSGAAEESNE
jgi:RNA polymerase sigma factor (sigma-70 family)